MSRELNIMNNLLMKQLSNADATRYAHMSPADKSRMLAIKGELPESTSGSPFETSSAYDAYWDTLELIDSGDVNKINKLLSSLISQLKTVSILPAPAAAVNTLS
jgi:hypothetical protein